MAQIRNLRNFDEAEVSDAAVEPVIRRLQDPLQVARSKQLVYRWWAAYREAPSDRWKYPLSQALEHATASIPALDGSNLVLIDTSGSMGSTMSGRSTMRLAEAAAVFGFALAARGWRGGAHTDVVGFASGSFTHPLKRGGSILAEVERFVGRIGEVGHGTDALNALARHYSGHKRVFIVSDEQTVHHSATVQDITVAGAARGVTVYVVNLGGYAKSLVASTPGVHHLAGLSDKTFVQLPLLERGQDAPWPWQVNAATGATDEE